jgi:aryl-alcohol dehydrogenase-like predicted oxidoreductase
MRTVCIAPLDRHVSAIGFGCASLGSRISAKNGQRAIARALDHGVTWFDVAPPYGDGNAEALLGQSLRGRRDKVVICTKFGIAPPRVSLPARLIRPLARSAVAAFPILRRAASKARPTGGHAPIDPDTIEASVTRSLRLLCTDRIDVLAVHEPTVHDATNPGIFEVLRRLIEKGLVRSVSIAGSPESIEAAGLTAESIAFAQFADTPITDAAARLRASLPVPAPTFVTHGVFGSGVTQALESMTATQRHRIAALADSHGIDFLKSPADLLLRFAFSNNPDGVVLISMFDTTHIERNIAVSCLPPIPGFAAAIRGSLA